MITEQRLTYAVPLDTTTVPQRLLDLDQRERGNPLPWRGQFTPQLVQVLLETYASDAGAVLDPFMGSGTVLCEAGRQHRTAVGVEVNPAAVILANTYRFINVAHGPREHTLDHLEDLLRSYVPDGPTLFAPDAHKLDDDRLADALLQWHRRAGEAWDRWAIESLLLRAGLGEPKLAVSGTYDAWRRLRAIIRALPYSDQALSPTHADARALPVPDGSVGLVLTSPPYINVFNYHQQYRKAVEALGYNVLHVARSEIGSNRKHRGNRFLTVVQYCLDMADVLRELRRVCRPDAQLIFVVGRESRVRKTPFYNGAVLAALATQCAGLSIENRQQRSFVNRFGQRIYEDILHFGLNGADAKTNSPRMVGLLALRDAISRAPSESRSDLESALDCVDAVTSSPLLNTEEFANDG